MMKVILAASGAFALPSLEILAEKLPPGSLRVVSQPDRRQGRGRHHQPTPVKRRALELELPVITPEKLEHWQNETFLSTFTADFLVVIDYGQLVPRSLIDFPGQAAINLHPSLLPLHRGPAPITWTLLNGDAATGVTTQLLADKIDCGDILLQKKTAVKPAETREQLTERLRKLGAELVWETLEQWQAGLIKPVPQKDDQATYAPKLQKSDGLLDWNRDVRELERRIRALNPWPGTYTFWRGKRLKILTARLETEKPQEAMVPGTILVSGKTLSVACGQGFLQITKVQPEGKRPQAVHDFLQGHQAASGEQFNSREKISSP